MMNERIQRALLSIPYYIVLTTTICLAMCAPPLWIERMFWETEVSASNQGLGAALAREAFERGELKLLELRGTRDSKDTGEMEGVCHVWTWHDLPADATWPEQLFDCPFRVSRSAYVKGWNDAMRRRVAQGDPEVESSKD